MVRLFGVLVGGALIGVTLVFFIGVYGTKTRHLRVDPASVELREPRPEAIRSPFNTASGIRAAKKRTNTGGRSRFQGIKPAASSAAADDDSTWMTNAVNFFGDSQPPAYFLWRDGYQVGPDLATWSDQNRQALAAYLRDWQLPVQQPDVEGTLPLSLVSRISRSHKITKPQWVLIKLPACKVWVDNPMAREKTTWDGACDGRNAGGEGTLKREFIRGGRRMVAGFKGTLVDGKAEGWGLSQTVQGYLYEGMHKRGLFHGEGVLRLGESGEEIYRGEFSEGLPHGRGQYMTAAGPVEGSWDKGCYGGGEAIALMRHASECKSGSFLGSLFD